MLQIFHKKSSKGFTLIELLVVIAIIGVLASIVLASLNTARRKGRDARRVADIKSIQTALELYFDSNAEYPETIATIVPQFLPVDPLDPGTGAIYPYTNITNSAGTACDAATTAGTCLYYHLGAKLEDVSNTGLKSDRDAEDLAGSDVVVDGLSTVAACGSEAGVTGATDLCYDVTP